MVLGRGWLYTEPSDLILNIIQQKKGLKVQHKEEPYTLFQNSALTICPLLCSVLIVEFLPDVGLVPRGTTHRANEQSQLALHPTLTVTVR